MAPSPTSQRSATSSSPGFFFSPIPNSASYSPLPSGMTSGPDIASISTPRTSTGSSDSDDRSSWKLTLTGALGYSIQPDPMWLGNENASDLELDAARKCPKDEKPPTEAVQSDQVARAADLSSPPCHDDLQTWNSSSPLQKDNHEVRQSSGLSTEGPLEDSIVSSPHNSLQEGSVPPSPTPKDAVSGVPQPTDANSLQNQPYQPEKFDTHKNPEIRPCKGHMILDEFKRKKKQEEFEYIQGKRKNAPDRRRLHEGKIPGRRNENRNHDYHNNDDDDDDDYLSDEFACEDLEAEDDFERARKIHMLRRKQEADLAVFRQTMRKTTGAQSVEETKHPVPAIMLLRPGYDRIADLTIEVGTSDVSAIPPYDADHVQENENEDEDIPLGILREHGFPKLHSRAPSRPEGAAPSIIHTSRQPLTPPLSNSNANSSTPTPQYSVRSEGSNLAASLPDPFYGASVTAEAGSSRDSMNFHAGAISGYASHPNERIPQQLGAHTIGESRGIPSTYSPYQSSGLVGVIDAEQRAKAMRRTSPGRAMQANTTRASSPMSMMGPQRNPNLMGLHPGPYTKTAPSSSAPDIVAGPATDSTINPMGAFIQAINKQSEMFSTILAMQHQQMAEGYIQSQHGMNPMGLRYRPSYSSMYCGPPGPDFFQDPMANQLMASHHRSGWLSTDMGGKLPEASMPRLTQSYFHYNNSLMQNEKQSQFSRPGSRWGSGPSLFAPSERGNVGQPRRYRALSCKLSVQGLGLGFIPQFSSSVRSLSRETSRMSISRGRSPLRHHLDSRSVVTSPLCRSLHVSPSTRGLGRSLSRGMPQHPRGPSSSSTRSILCYSNSKPDELEDEEQIWAELRRNTRKEAGAVN